MAGAESHEIQETILRLQFTDPSFDDLVVRAYAADSGVIESVGALAFIDSSAELTQEAYAAVLAARDEFAEALVEWNLTRRGKPVPATSAGVRKLPIEYLWQIIGAWLDGTRQILRAQLGAKQIDEAQLPMELGG